MFREGMLAAEDCFENAKHYAWHTSLSMV
jgi:hypothetical protein